MKWKQYFLWFCVASFITVSSALINVELTVIQYDNPLGTSYLRNNTQGVRKCCDVGGDLCTSRNDTCDVFFLFCIGKMSNDPNNPGCIGCSIDMSRSVAQNVYHIEDGRKSGLLRYGNLSQWMINDTMLSAQVLDIDEVTTGGKDWSVNPDVIDKFSQPLTFRPSASYWNATKHIIHFQQHVSLDLQLRVWCADGWVGDSCNISCNHDDYHTCSASDGMVEPLLECSVQEMLVLKMLVPVQKVAPPSVLLTKLYSFIADYICPNTAINVSVGIDSVRSVGLSQTDILFHASCDGVAVSRSKFQEMVYILSVVTSRLSKPSQIFAVPIEVPEIKFIPASQVRMLVQIRIVFYENIAARNNCNRGTKGALCNPRLTIEFLKNSVLGHTYVRNADRFVDCNGALVDIDDDNTTQADNSTFIFSVKTYPSIINIKVSDLTQSQNTVANYGLAMNQTTVGSNFLTAQPHLYSGKAANTKLSVEVIAWCSNCHYGNQCEHLISNCNSGSTVVPPDCQSSTDCFHGACVDGVCLCDGWTGPTCNIDIDECGLGYCQHAQTCQNTPGNYTCICNEGFKGRNCGEDIDECTSSPCVGGSICLNTLGSYSCICSNGTVSDHCFTDFCAKYPCKNNGTCANNLDDDTFNCTCSPGWAGTLCDGNVNECLNASICQNGGTCHDTNGSFYCDCPVNVTGTHCESDIDECMKNPPVCMNSGTCVNTFGGFNCSCTPQWMGPTCADDVDECNSTLSTCIYGECRNTDGSFTCSCYHGWSGFNCSEDIDECHLEQTSPCFNHATCTNTLGSFKCNCTSGWTGSHCTKDVDECEDNLFACSLSGNCTNFDGGYNCTCLRGWSGEFCDMDIDECSSNNLCQHSGQCVNTEGGYTCNCPSNWTGINCDTDINECLSNPCNNGGTCQNSQGAFKCLCPDAWTGTLCNVDVNECVKQANICAHGGQCVNTDGGYTCICPPQWTGPLCNTDNDECKAFQPCMHGGMCTNTVGGYTCSCLPAWTGNNCTDNVNECSVYPDICQNGGSCMDMLGDYNCSCSPGYSGKNCTTDIDECVSLDACKNHGKCSNTFGSYSCVCPSSWTGAVCDLDIDECQEAQICSNHGSCTNKPGSFSCQCENAWSGLNCSIDVNECNQNPCIHGKCTNTVGSYSCACDAGWQGDICNINIDNCQGIDCSGHGSCKDLINDYTCDCDLGFSGNYCEINDNECDPNPCLNNGLCSDHDGYYQCACPEGWTGKNCDTDIDECVENPCKTSERCVNTQGGHHCQSVNFVKPTMSSSTVPTTPVPTTLTTTSPVLENSKEKSTSLAPIAGGAAGGVILLIVIIIVVVFIKRRRRDSESDRNFENVEVDEVRDMDGMKSTMIYNPTYNTLYTEHTSA